MIRLVATSDKYSYEDPIILADPDEDVDSKLTRRVFLPQLVDNPHNPDASVRGVILHERRKSISEPWEPVEAIDLRRLKGGEGVKLPIKAGALREFYEGLKRLYAKPIGDKGWTDEDDLVLVPAGEHIELSERAKDVLIRLLSSSGGREELWDFIEELEPNFAETVALRRQYELRRDALNEFEHALEENSWDEDDWEKFFKRNEWIFGHGLAYQYLKDLENQPRVGGMKLDGSGTQKGDFMLATRSTGVSFVVIVDIKTPQTKLLARQRETIYRPTSDLTGGAAQLQAYCHTWSVEGSRLPANVQRLLKDQTYSFHPKGVLVAGNTTEFADDMDKIRSFELFRQHTANPEIITFDELLARAQAAIELRQEWSS